MNKDLQTNSEKMLIVNQYFDLVIYILRDSDYLALHSLNFILYVYPTCVFMDLSCNSPSDPSNWTIPVPQFIRILFIMCQINKLYVAE